MLGVKFLRKKNNIVVKVTKKLSNTSSGLNFFLFNEGGDYRYNGYFVGLYGKEIFIFQNNEIKN